MSVGIQAPDYSHTQKAPLCLLLYFSAICCLALPLLLPTVPGSPAPLIPVAVGVLTALTGMACHYLTVVDEGDWLALRFGPLPVFQRKVRYVDIECVEIGRTLFLDGWGIHYSVRGGWVWNLWGRDCVVVHWKQGGVLRIGTDDAENLAAFLQARIQ